MSVEFRCNQCQYLLRTGAETVGKKARCPQCGNIQVVPDLTSTESVDASPFASSQQNAPNINPPLQQNPFAGDPTPNPYEATATSASVITRPTNPRSKLLGPAIANLVVSILGLLLTGLTTLAGIVSVTTEGMDDDDAVMLVFCGVSLLTFLIACIGSIQMLRQRTYALAMAAAVISIVPGNCFWCVTLPVGIWGLVVLLDRDVRNSFR